MAVNHVHVDCDPTRVAALWGDGRRYAEWVVGAKRIRAVDTSWPAVGTRIYHTVGIGPLKIDDETEVVDEGPPTRLVLEARAFPLGRARVALEVVAADGGSRVTMVETVETPRALRRLLDPLIHLRNVEALRRLSKLLEEHATGP